MLRMKRISKNDPIFATGKQKTIHGIGRKRIQMDIMINR
jgi:hypothetical protein